MITILDRLPQRDMPGTSRLFGDFVEDPGAGLPPFLPGVAKDEGRWERSIAGAREAIGKIPAGKRRKFIAHLVEFNKRQGANDELLAKIRKAEHGDAFFILTGQQPGLLGGGLMVGYKILTAVCLARYLERRFPIECIPLYWVGADDDDFQEIRSLFLFSAGWTPLRIELPAEAHESLRPVGEIACEWVLKVWSAVSPMATSFPCYEYVDACIRSAARSSRDHGEMTARLMVSLFGGDLAVVDARSVELKEHAREVISAFIDEEDAVCDLVADAGSRLAERGYHAQITPGGDCGVFLLENGRRSRVPRADAGVLKERAREGMERLYPGVILRNLVQDQAFVPLAVVLGPAEIAYRAQLGCIYPKFGVGFPSPFPRMSATFVPPPLAEVLDEARIEGRDLVKDPRIVAARLLESMGDDVITRESEAFLAGITRETDRFLAAVKGRLPGGGDGRVEKRVRDALGRFHQAVKALKDDERKAIAKNKPWLGELETVFHPAGGPQERALSLLVPFLLSGEDALEELCRMGMEFVGDLMDGQAKHLVYSMKRGR
jgi:uncharacterized protein YllA (UPF0747 family)